MSLLICPVCAAPLRRGESAYLCPRGHNFDRAREGYVHLLPANRMHSRRPGDDREMSAARNRFLSGGWYAPLRAALCGLALEHAPSCASVLDAGCGEGYYTAGIHTALAEAGREPRTAGIDLSKPSLRFAARRLREAEFVLASVYHLPVAAGRIDLLLDCFSPLALGEFHRVLRPGGIFLYVVPAARHLWELKELLYDRPYLNPEESVPYAGFRHLGVLPVDVRLPIRESGTLMDLFSMTPYRWKTPREGIERLSQCSCLDVTASFRIHIFQKETSAASP